jgi:hypothetical protein
MARTVCSLAITICFLAQTVCSLARTICSLARTIYSLIFGFRCLSLLTLTYLQLNNIYISFCRTQARQQDLYASEARVVKHQLAY